MARSLGSGYLFADDSETLAETARADLRRRALVIATAAVEGVRRRIDADAIAVDERKDAGVAAAQRRRTAAHVAALAAIVGVPIEERARPIAEDGLVDTPVHACAVDALPSS